jgi:hypothetical protein
MFSWSRPIPTPLAQYGGVPSAHPSQLPGPRVFPPPFYPQQEPVSYAGWVTARAQYTRAGGPPSTSFSTPMDASQRTQQRQRDAVGKTAYGVGSNGGWIGTAHVDPSGTRSALRRVRSGGSVAPAKKGSLFR